MEYIHRQRVVGEYVADIVVSDKIILELKAADALRPDHEAQLINYLKATSFEVGLLPNFGHKPEVRRKIFTNNLKGRAVLPPASKGLTSHTSSRGNL